MQITILGEDCLQVASQLGRHLILVSFACKTTRSIATIIQQSQNTSTGDGICFHHLLKCYYDQSYLGNDKYKTLEI